MATRPSCALVMHTNLEIFCFLQRSANHRDGALQSGELHRSLQCTVNALSDAADHFQKARRVYRLHEPGAVTLDTSAVAFNGSISIYPALTHPFP